jgi:GNAT superfamily N-acetyltransferase
MRFWRAIDRSFEGVEDAWWGAVVTDSRFPTIWDVNYARIETRSPELGLTEVEALLLPAIRGSGATNEHLVTFHPQEQIDLLSELGQRGDKISWDVVMSLTTLAWEGPQEVETEGVEEVDPPTDGFWSRLRGSMREFKIEDPSALDQLLAIERLLFAAGGKRWFTVRRDGVEMAFASITIAEGVGYIDHVVTLPEARGRGFATALTQRAISESVAAGATEVFLLVDPDGPRRLYERLGFRRAADIASSLRPLP